MGKTPGAMRLASYFASGETRHGKGVGQFCIGGVWETQRKTQGYKSNRPENDSTFGCDGEPKLVRIQPDALDDFY